MYPVVRLAKELLIHRKAPRLGLFDTHVSHHICWPQDIDVWMELNNGRTLTLYDLGRMVLFQRTGIIAVMRRNGWAGTVAGSSVRYRRRVRMFHRVEMRTRILGWDARFLYMEQSMWRNGECTSNALFRNAVTSAKGMVPMADTAQAMGADPVSPTLPEWVRAWAEADAQRPWPPLT
ncbi:acyl-CoA thioesterase [Oceaniglobus trochenteri]|uniref:acyl-CoA thioesterase n=1 Tax=Oceaniglobus trochenteri TaxID=2763260 RepID=UPI001CFF7D18|nr:acyl-CoA thioesterase [Oceaniglobus trochenteri]